MGECLVCSLEDEIFQGSGVSCFFVFFTMVPNGIDTTRFPCSALNVKVVRNSRQARTNGRSNHDYVEVACCLKSSLVLSCLFSFIFLLSLSLVSFSSLFISVSLPFSLSSSLSLCVSLRVICVVWCVCVLSRLALLSLSIS